VGGGDRNYHNFLHTLVRENHLETRIRFWGQVENALPYIHQADVLLLCSRCEAFARVVIEAMKAGKPIIGAASGGTLEQIKDGFNGFLYEPQNYRDLAAKIKHCHDHPELTQKMGTDARKWAVQTFNQANYTRELEKILEQLK
jgi:glycosyltransferase involved in cell wall biosynthesis